MDELELYILRIPDFKIKTAAQLIDYFAFYLQQIDSQNAFSAAQISKCFDSLSLPPYSNISAYLSRNCRKKGKYLKRAEGYTLNRYTQELIALEVEKVITPPVSLNLIDLSIFDQTPYYIKSTAKELIQCYDSGFYNATLVLMRKLTETLIIECFERFGADDEIKDQNGVFFFLSELIPHYIGSSKWNSSRNVIKSLTAVKQYGDLSAHNRRYLAKKSDIDGFKSELRQALQEIILTIDYPNWVRSPAK